MNRKLYLTMRFLGLLLFSIVVGLGLASRGIYANQTLFWVLTSGLLLIFVMGVHLVTDRFVEKHYGIKVKR